MVTNKKLLQKLVRSISKQKGLQYQEIGTKDIIYRRQNQNNEQPTT